MSLINIVIMTGDRFYAVRFPIRYRVWMTTGRAVQISIFGNFIGFIIGSISFSVTFVAGIIMNFNHSTLTHNCEQFDNLYPIYGEFVFFYFNTLSISVIITIMLFVNVYIFLIARRHMKGRALRIGQKINTFDMKASRITTTIIIMFLICIIPEGVYLLGDFNSYNNHFWSFWFGAISEILICSNSMINPLIYSLGNSTFRKNFKKLFCTRILTRNICKCRE
ncbi:adenosine receptor A2a-like [Antedon mediterranea]|uniref:adenosine receptor A2a-like n=1 Tax=Antedon mediterranea TaxID=105859 RepID=UPI003AF8D699